MTIKVKPNEYILGGNSEIFFTPTDQDGNFFTPAEMRLSIKDPSGTILTVSGGDLIMASGYFYHLYKYPEIGWYETEVWVADSEGREIVKADGFEVVDRLYPEP